MFSSTCEIDRSETAREDSEGAKPRELTSMVTKKKNPVQIKKTGTPALALPPPCCHIGIHARRPRCSKHVMITAGAKITHRVRQRE